MKKRKLGLIMLLLLNYLICFGYQNKTLYKLTGTIKSNKELLQGALVKITPSGKTQITDAKGSFSFELEKGKYKVECQFLGMLGYSKEINLTKDTKLDITLELTDLNLEEIEITGKPTMDVNSVNMGASYMDVMTIKQLPTFMGEVDVLKSINTLPGVANVGEGSTGFYVRGSSADQNLILMDDVPVFNATHLFGFFSIYNPDALKSYTLHRSGMSAKYGSRISSILDVKLKDGNPDKIKVMAGISPVTFKLGVEGPVNDKSSFLFTSRGAFPDYVLNLFPDDSIKNSSGHFYDFNFKYKYVINNKNNISLSTYYSKDGFKFSKETEYSWSNMLGSIKWNHIFNDNFSGTFTASKSNYDNRTDNNTFGENYKLTSGIHFTQLKADFNFIKSDKHVIDFGGGMYDYIIKPGKMETFANSTLNPKELKDDVGTEFFSYLNDEIKVNDKLSVSLGLRHTYYIKKGASDVYSYEIGRPKSEVSITDTTYYGKGEKVVSYQGFEPRAAIKYSLNKNSSIKASFSRTRQYIQLIANTATITPVNVWKLSNNLIEPQVSDQFSIGYFKLTPNNKYEFSWELYYKNLSNQLDYKDGAKIFLNPILEADLLYGDGHSYGSEWLLKKNSGRLNGWLSLSISRSFLTMKGNNEEETINDGLKYPSNYDKPINFNLFFNYKLDPASSKWTFSLNYNYSTGRPITASDSWYNYNGHSYANYFGRNQERIPDYHRMDISFNYNSDSSKKVQTNWAITLYNMYFRRNAYSVFYKQYLGSPTQAYKMSVVGTMVPSIAFNIKF